MARDRRPGKSPKGDDGAAKKKKRRLSAVQEVALAPNNDDVERASTPSRSSATPSKRRKPRRSLVGSTNWEADLGDIYRTCIQLGTQNKISAKNAWNLRLLDYIDNVLDAEDSTSKKKAQASGTKSGDALEQSICNFQLASNTLDTSVKIYAYRVDAVHTDAYKVLGGLNRTEVSSRVKEALADDDHDDEDEDGQRSKKAQRQRKTASLASTLESNVANINTKALDTECAVDPLFHKTSAAFDEGGAKGLLLSQLGVSDGGNIVFDSTEYDAEAISEEGQELDLSALQQLIKPDWATAAVCPYFSNFSFHHVAGEETELGDQPSGTSGLNVVPADFPTLDEVSNDAPYPDEIPMPEAGADFVGGLDDDSNGGFDSADFSQPVGFDGPEGMDEDLGDRQAVAGVIGEIFGTGGVVKEFDYSKVLGEDSGAFSYFSKRLMDNWAGPDHWKFRTPAAAASAAYVKPKAAKKKEFFIDFFAEDDADYEELFKKPARGTTTLSAQVLNKEANNTLPPDKHYDIKMLTRLFLRPSKPIGYRRVAGGSQMTEGDEALRDAPEHWAPLDAATETFDMSGEGDDDDGAGVFGWEGADDSNGATFTEDLIDEPEKVQHVPITFAKRAKKVDVEKLKGCIWKQLCLPSDGSEVAPDAAPAEKIAGEEPVSFTNILEDLPQVVPAKQLPDVSVPMCFICLLDLANKKGLEIDQAGESDLRISNYVPQAS